MIEELTIVSVDLVWTGGSFCRKWAEILMWCAVFPVTIDKIWLRYRTRLKVDELVKSTMIYKCTSGLWNLGSVQILGHTGFFGLIRNHVDWSNRFLGFYHFLKKFCSILLKRSLLIVSRLPLAKLSKPAAILCIMQSQLSKAADKLISRPTWTQSSRIYNSCWKWRRIEYYRFWTF